MVIFDVKRSFFKKSELGISLDQRCEFLLGFLNLQSTKIFLNKGVDRLFLS